MKNESEFALKTMSDQKIEEEIELAEKYRDFSYIGMLEGIVKMR